MGAFDSEGEEMTGGVKARANDIAEHVGPDDVYLLLVELFGEHLHAGY
jgi:hypothetical protein